MMTGSMVGFDRPEERPAAASPAGSEWLMPSLTLLLAAVATAQMLFFVPRTLFVLQRFGGRTPGYLNLLISIPPWLAVVSAVAFVAVVVRHRGSLRQSALLASVATAANVGLIVCLLGSLFEVLSRA